MDTVASMGLVIQILESDLAGISSRFGDGSIGKDLERRMVGRLNTLQINLG